MDEFRVVLIQIERRLTQSERERFLFLVAPYITRSQEENSSTGGTLDVLQTLLEQGRITPNDFSFLIDVFQKIECWTAVNYLIQFQHKQNRDSSESPEPVRAVLVDNEAEDSVKFLKAKTPIEKAKKSRFSFEILRKYWIFALLLTLMVVFSAVGLAFVPKTHSCTVKNGRTTPPFTNIRPCSRWSPIGTTILGQNGIPGAEKTQLNSPIDLLFDHQGFLYVSDMNNNRIQRFHPSQPTNVTTIVNEILSPRQIFFHYETKTLFIVEFDQDRILRWNLAKNRLEKSLEGCRSCSGVFVSSDSQIFIVEKERHRLLKCPFDADRVENCHVYAGVTDENTKSLKNLNGPTIVTGNGKILFVVDFGNERIQKFDPNNEKGQTVFYQSDRLPFHLLVDDFQTIYSTMCRQLPRNDSECFILRIHPDNKTDRIPTNNSSSISQTFFHPGQNTLRKPNGFAFDQFGNLYVADTGNHRVVRFDVTCNECQT